MTRNRASASSRGVAHDRSNLATPRSQRLLGVASTKHREGQLRSRNSAEKAGLEQPLDACQVPVLRCQHHWRDTVGAPRVGWDALLSKQCVGALDSAMLAREVQGSVARLGDSG